MEELPQTMLIGIPDEGRDVIWRWWETLTNETRGELIDMADSRREECFFGLVPDGEVLPVVKGGCFIPHDDAWGFEDWEDNWREYLVEHPAKSLGDRWHEDSVFIMSQLPTLNYFGGCWIVGWGQTRFKDEELPPSEQK